MKKRIFLTIAALFLFLGSVNSGLAVTIESYTLNFSAASSLLTGAGVANVDNVFELGFTQAQAFVGFKDLDSSGGISANDTFDDYFAIRIATFSDFDGNPIFSSGYGVDHELTLLGHLKGVQTGDNEYAITDIVSLGIFFDSGAGFTPSNTNNLFTYADGIQVETGTLIAGGGVNQGPIISGTFDLIVDLQDLLHTIHPQGEYFELDSNGNPFPMQLVFGIVDSNTDAGKDVNVAAFESYFGFDADNDFDFFQTAWNDGTISKALIPEPSTVLLLGFGLIGMAGMGRRKFFNK